MHFHQTHPQEPGPGPEPDIECPICYNPIKERNRVVTKCGHLFCLECITHHTISNLNSVSSHSSNLACPMCRTSIIEHNSHVYPPININRNVSNRDSIHDVARDLSILSQILLDKIEQSDSRFYNRWYPWFNQRLETLESVNMYPPDIMNTYYMDNNVIHSDNVVHIQYNDSHDDDNDDIDDDDIVSDDNDSVS